MILLEPEEIYSSWPSVMSWVVGVRDRLVAIAQAKKIYKWGNEDCPHKKEGWHTPRWQSECHKCWQALYEEIK